MLLHVVGIWDRIFPTYFTYLRIQLQEDDRRMDDDHEYQVEINDYFHGGDVLVNRLIGVHEVAKGVH